MSTAFAELVAEQQGMMISRSAGQASDKQPLPHGHPFKVHCVIVLNDRIDPMNALQTESGIVVGCLPKIHHRATEQGWRQAKNSHKHKECCSAEAKTAAVFT